MNNKIIIILILAFQIILINKATAAVCPTGYTWNGSACIATYPATLVGAVTYNVNTSVCSYGYDTYNPFCLHETTGYVATTAFPNSKPISVCTFGHDGNMGYYYCAGETTGYVATTAFPNSKPISVCTFGHDGNMGYYYCAGETTGYVATTPGTYGGTYTCPSGGTLSGTTCYLTAAECTICPSGFTWQPTTHLCKYSYPATLVGALYFNYFAGTAYWMEFDPGQNTYPVCLIMDSTPENGCMKWGAGLVYPFPGSIQFCSNIDEWGGCAGIYFYGASSPTTYGGTYTCPSGGTLSGTTCTITQNPTCAAPTTCTSPRYPAGWITLPTSTSIAAGQKVKAADINNIRNNINLMRANAGLGACAYAENIIAGTTRIKKSHLDELRNCIGGVYTTCGTPQPAFSTPNILGGITKIKAIDIMEIINLVNNAP